MARDGTYEIHLHTAGHLTVILPLFSLFRQNFYVPLSTNSTRHDARPKHPLNDGGECSTGALDSTTMDCVVDCFVQRRLGRMAERVGRMLGLAAVKRRGRSSHRGS
jgi:hypothetical protein